MVSVIIVVYNASKYLRSAVESVLNQTYRNFEIIAVDDGSTDSTIDILNEYSHLPNFILIRNQHTKNLGGNRNQAIKIAKGEYIAFIDGDDIWENDKLEVQLGYMVKYEMASSNACLINENGEVFSKRHSNKYDEDSEIKLSDLLTDNIIIVSSVLIKKTAIENAGFFEDGSDTRAEDYVLWLSFLKNNTIKYINKPLLRYRIHAENWSNSTMVDWVRLLQRTIDIRSEYVKHNNDEIRIAAIKGCINMYLELTKVSYKNKNFQNARNYLKSLLSIYNQKISLKYLKYVFGYIYISFLTLIWKK